MFFRVSASFSKEELLPIIGKSLPKNVTMHCFCFDCLFKVRNIFLHANSLVFLVKNLLMRRKLRTSLNLVRNIFLL